MNWGKKEKCIDLAENLSKCFNSISQNSLGGRTFQKFWFKFCISALKP